MPVRVIEDKCIGCGDCADVCPTEVFDIIDDKSQTTRIEDCIDCMACVDACPTDAIEPIDD